MRETAACVQQPEQKTGLPGYATICHEIKLNGKAKKGPENRISVVVDKAAARGANPAYGKSF
jgi:hypothetical protein